MTTSFSEEWVRTSDAISALGISRDTLLRRCRDGYLKPGQHYIASGPHRTSPRLWSISAVRTAMAGWTGPAQQLECSTSELDSKPQSLNNSAIKTLNVIEKMNVVPAEMTDTIRRVLEALPNDRF